MGMKSDVHNMYMEEVRLGENELQPVSGNYFNAVWRERVPELKCTLSTGVRASTVSNCLVSWCAFHPVPCCSCMVLCQVCDM